MRGGFAPSGGAVVGRFHALAEDADPPADPERWALRGRPSRVAAQMLSAGYHGMIAVGIGDSPGAALWWRSLDGRHWQPLQTFPPLGATTCGGATCGRQPNGTLIGDGHRLVAVRGGSDAAALASTDGQRWTALALSGDIPSAQAPSPPSARRSARSTGPRPGSARP